MRQGQGLLTSTGVMNGGTAEVDEQRVLGRKGDAHIDPPPLQALPCLRRCGRAVFFNMAKPGTALDGLRLDKIHLRVL